MAWKNLEDGRFFYTMVVKSKDEYGTWYCSLAIPKGIRDVYEQTEMNGMERWLVGKYVGFTATLTPSHKTQDLAYGRRPTNGRLV